MVLLYIKNGLVTLGRLRFDFGVEAEGFSAYCERPHAVPRAIETPLGRLDGCEVVSENGGVSIMLDAAQDGARTYLRLRAVNRTGGTLHPKKLALIRADGEGVRLEDGLGAWSVFKNGIRKNDYVCVHNFGDPAFDLRDALACGSDDESLELSPRAADSETGETRAETVIPRIGSAYMTVLRHNATGDSLLMGFLSMREQFGLTRLSLTEDARALDELLVYTAVDGAVWMPDEMIASEWLVLDERDAFTAIAAYASDSGKIAGAGKPVAPPTGWCSWYFYYESVSENDILKNARFIRENGLPARVIQVDMGWEERLGDWYPNHRFPRGMRALTDDLHAMGFLAGLWISPFWIEPRSEIHREHSEWLLRDREGQLVEFVCHIPGYVIDTSIPEACAWIEETARRVTRDYGFDYIKTDFLRAVSLRTDAVYKNAVTRAQALRLGLEALRRGAGDRFILGCGGQYGPTVGLLDGNRTSNDISATWKSVCFTFKKNILRWWMQPAWGVSDADCVIIRGPGEGEPGYQAGLGRIPQGAFKPEDMRAITAAFKAGGGLVMLGDELFSLPQAKIDAVRELLSPDGVSAVPRDMFDSPMPAVLHKVAERRETVTLINWGNAVKTFSHPLRYMTGRSTGAFLTLNDAPLGRFAPDDIVTVSVEPHGAAVISIE